MPVTPSGKPTRETVRRTQQERSAESGRRLMEAAIELIAEQGFRSTTAAEIGERAGYSASMVQFRYGTKEALLETLLKEEWESRFRVAPDPAHSGMEQLLAQVELFRVQMREHPALMRGFCVLSFEAIGSRTKMRGWLSAWMQRSHELITGSMHRGVADGSIRAGLDPVIESGAVVADYVGLGFRWLALPEQFDYERELSALRDRLTDRYGVTPPDSPR